MEKRSEDWSEEKKIGIIYWIERLWESNDDGYGREGSGVVEREKWGGDLEGGEEGEGGQERFLSDTAKDC